MIRYYQIWPNMMKDDQILPDMTKYDQILSHRRKKIMSKNAIKKYKKSTTIYKI